MIRRIAFGLGSNVGDSVFYLSQAKDALKQLPRLLPETICCSSLYQSPPLLPEGAPEAWNLPFINQVVTFECREDYPFEPLQWLADIKMIEQQLGRIHRGHWSPREIDIDMIAIEGMHIRHPELQIPHAQAHLRAFVVIPLAEIWPECKLANGQAASALAESFPPLKILD